MTDAEGHVTTTRYYPDGKVWRVIDANGTDTVINRYNDKDGSLQEVEDAQGNVTRYEYNGFKGLKKTLYPDRHDVNDNYEAPTYDWYRRVIQARGRSGQTIGLAYDSFGRVRTKSVYDPNELLVNTITYSYDALGRVYHVTDNTGTTRNIYDHVGRLSRVQYPGGKTVSYEYDACGNRTRLTYPDGMQITYDYDQLNRMTAVRDVNGVALASYSFDARSRRTALIYANGATAGYEYDTASRLMELDNQTNSGHHTYSYMYDNVGNRTSMTVTDSVGSRAHVYSYDNTYQITGVNYPAELDYLATDTTFAYDDAGNLVTPDPDPGRTSVVDGSGACNYTSNALNQYTAAGTTSFQYDDSGNMTHDGRYTYTYDPENRLTQVQKPNPPTQQLNSFAAYTKGGAAVWAADEYFAHSGSIDDDEESWMYIDVSGPGTVAFSWKTSSEEYSDCLEFSIDGIFRAELSGERDWEQYSYPITTAGSHRLKWRYHKDSSGYAGDDRGWVQAVTFTPPPQPAPDQVAQGVDSQLAFTTGGDGAYSGWSYWDASSYYDGDCARSSTAIGDGEESWMQTTVSGPGTVTFWWKVSSEQWGDWLEFYVDGQLQSNPLSGEVAWTQKTCTITGSGVHTLRWRYIKDGSLSYGDDCGWESRGQVLQ